MGWSIYPSCSLEAKGIAKLVLQMAGEDDKEQRECTFCLRLAVRAFSIMLINFIFCVLEQRAPTSLWIAESTQSMPYNAATLCSGFYLLDAIDRHRRQSYPRVSLITIAMQCYSVPMRQV